MEDVERSEDRQMVTASYAPPLEERTSSYTHGDSDDVFLDTGYY